MHLYTSFLVNFHQCLHGVCAGQLQRSLRDYIGNEVVRTPCDFATIFSSTEHWQGTEVSNVRAGAVIAVRQRRPGYSAIRAYF